MQPESPLDNQTLKQRYFSEYRIWKVLGEQSPKFRYVQEQIFSLSKIEEQLIEFLHQSGLNFILHPRFEPATFIVITVRLQQAVQDVRLEVSEGIAPLGTFIVPRTPFAEQLKNWLDTTFGRSNYQKKLLVSTRSFIHYTYSLPFVPDMPKLDGSIPPQESADSRKTTHLFNFNNKEQLFLNLLEETVLANTDTDNPMKVRVYPRQEASGSIELVVSRLEGRQPARVFATGFQPVTYQIITENSSLSVPLKTYLDNALGEHNLDMALSRLHSRFISLIYTLRLKDIQLDDTEEDE